MPPVFILPYSRLRLTFMHLCKPGHTKGALATGSGWMTEESFYEWLKTFVYYLDVDPHVRTDRERFYMLVVDRHPAHCSER